jgi:hypothetical protein
MGQLAEIVFEDVKSSDLEAVLLSIADPQSLSPADRERLVRFRAEQRDDAIGLYPVMLAIGDLRIENGACRILRYEGKYDVEINWDYDLLDNALARQWIEAVHERAMETARRYRITQYYAGLEPASDAETRFFTCGSRGPLGAVGPDPSI